MLKSNLCGPSAMNLRSTSSEDGRRSKLTFNIAREFHRSFVIVEKL